MSSYITVGDIVDRIIEKHDQHAGELIEYTTPPAPAPIEVTINLSLVVRWVMEELVDADMLDWGAAPEATP